MAERNPSFQDAFDEVLRTGVVGEHVAPERMVAYHNGLLPESEADAVQEHVAGCRECGDLLLELVRFEDDGATEEPDEAIADLEAEADWRALRSRIAGDEPQATPRKPPRGVSKPYVAWGLAASLLLSIGLGARVRFLSSELASLRQDQVHPAIVDLYSDGHTRSDPEESIVRGHGELFVVFLNPPTSFPPIVEYKAEILDADDRVVWSKALWPEDGRFSFILSRTQLTPGPYRIHLSAAEADTWEFVLQVGAPDR